LVESVAALASAGRTRVRQNGGPMNSKSDQSRGFYFENDIGMAATALKEMFGDGVGARVSDALGGSAF